MFSSLRNTVSIVSICDHMTTLSADPKIAQFQFSDILRTEYGLDRIVLAHTLPGGYIEKETWLMVFEADRKYVVKTIQYSLNRDYLETILTFQNYLHFNSSYPCAQVIATVGDELFVCLVDDKYLFVQTFLQGHVPSLTELDASYLSQMGTLLGRWCLASRTFLLEKPHRHILNQELTDRWWLEQHERLRHRCTCLQKSEIAHLHRILSECRLLLNGKIDQLEEGLIHNDFQTSNTLYTADQHQVHIIDFGEATYTYYILDLVTALFLFFTNGVDDSERLMAFLTSYQEYIQLEQREVAILDVLTRLKLTTNFIGDCTNIKSSDEYEQSPWLQSCSKWIRYLCQENQNFFLAMLSYKQAED